MNNCPNNIREARLYRGKQQKDIVAELKLQAPSVSDWERKKKYPTAENLKRLADYLDVSTDFLLARTNNPLCGNISRGNFKGNHLREARLKHGESVQYAAEAIGVSVSLYEQFENGVIDPSIDDLLAIAEHFSISADILLGIIWASYDENDRIITGEFKLKPGEQHIIELYRRAGDGDKTAINLILEKYKKVARSEEQAG